MGPTQPAVSTFGRLGIACCTVLMAITMGIGLSAKDAPLATAAIVISKTDPTKAPPRGTAETVLHYAQSRDSTRFTETRAYIYEVYRLAPLVGIDPAFVISQSALETADWTSFYWTNHLNPAGIGITQTGVPSYTWSSGTAAARFHLARLYVYVAGPIDVGNPLYPYRLDGPDYSHLFALGYDGQAQIIDDLTGKLGRRPHLWPEDRQSRQCHLCDRIQRSTAAGHASVRNRCVSRQRPVENPGRQYQEQLCGRRDRYPSARCIHHLRHGSTNCLRAGAVDVSAVGKLLTASMCSDQMTQ